MSLFSKIGKGIRKLTLKKVAKVALPIAALAIPGVGTVAAGAIGLATKGAMSAGKLIRGTATAAGGAIRTIAGEAVSTAQTLGSEANETLDTVGSARDVVEENAAQVGLKWDAFRGGGLTNTLNSLSKSVPTILMIGLGVVVLVMLLRKKA